MRKQKIKVKDRVMVLSGREKGKVGTVKLVNHKSSRALVEQVNIVKRHVKGNPYTGQSGGIQEQEAPIHYSNLALMCDSCAQATRVGYRFTQDGKKLRYCKKCNEMLD